MKKIVGILSAAAVLATSVFAADVSAKVKLDGNLFNYDGTKDKDPVSAVMIQHNTDESWNPVLKMATSGDNYGAEVGFYIGNWDATKMDGWNHGYGTGLKEWKIWFAPIDNLKLKVGRIDASLNTDTIDYDTRIFNYDEWGYQAEYSADGLTLNVGLHTGDPDKYWLSQSYDKEKDETKTNVAGFGVYGAYNADFGALSVLFDANKTFEDIKAGVGYKNAFGDLNLFADAALFYVKDQKSINKDHEAVKDELGLGFDVDVKYNKDAFGVEAYAQFKMAKFKNYTAINVQNLKDDKGNDTGSPVEFKDGKVTKIGDQSNDMTLFFKVKATYKLDNGVTLYGYFKDTDLLARRYTLKGYNKISSASEAESYEKDGDFVFISDIRLGATGSVGAASWDICGKIETGKGADFDKINFSVPVSFSVAF